MIPQLAAWIISLGMQEPRRALRPRSNGFGHVWIAIRHIAHTPRLAWLTVAQSVSFGFGEANFQFVTAFHRTLWPIWAIGALRTAAHGLAALSFWFAGPVIDRYSHLRVLIAGSTGICGLLCGFAGVCRRGDRRRDDRRYLGAHGGVGDATEHPFAGHPYLSGAVQKSLSEQRSASASM